MRWGASRTDSLEYYKVSWPDFGEMERLECFEDGGKLDLSLGTTLKVSGQLPYIDLPDLGNSLVRIYATMTDEDGEVYRTPLATMLPTSPNKDLSLKGTSGDVDLYSVLYLLQARKTRDVLTVPKGQNIIGYVTYLITSVGLPFLVNKESAATLNNDRTYDALTSYLEIINDLLDVAGFSSANVDGMGNVLISQYVSPSRLASSMTLRSGQYAVFAPTISYELDMFEVPNAYTCVYSSAESERPLSETVENRNPASSLSIPARGYIVDDGETISELGGIEEDDPDFETKARALLHDTAERRLMDASSKVESITITHLWVPFELGDNVTIEYSGVGAWTMNAYSKSIELGVGLKCATRLRRFIDG